MPIRLRLAAGFAAGLAVVLALAGGFVYVEVARNLSEALDANLAARADDARALVDSSSQGDARLKELGSENEGEAFIQVMRADGSIVGSTLPGGYEVLSRDQIAEATREDSTVDGVQIPESDDDYRVLAIPTERDNGPAVVVVGATTADMEETLSGLRRTLALGAPLCLLLASLIGYVLGSRALRPVEALRLRAREITLESAGERLPRPAADDELRRLADTLNEMLDRVETALRRERTFVSDASHELRTPLAILKSEIELIQRTGGSKADLQSALDSAAEEIDHLVLLAENLLVIARADRGSLPLRMEEVAPESVIQRVASRFERLVADAGRTLSLEVGAVGIHRLDPLRIDQAMANLTENALTHGRGDITLGARTTEQTLELFVRDQGPGFPADFRRHAFERFSRADPGRTDAGTGLGLAIVRAIAVAHGGRVGIDHTASGDTEVSLFIPI